MCVHSPITASVCSVIKIVSVQAIINVVMLLGFLAHGYVRLLFLFLFREQVLISEIGNR